MNSFQCGFDHIITTGGMMPKSLADRVRSRMCSNLFASYGATETGPVAVASAQALASIPGAVGFVLPDCAVEIVDDKGHPLPSGETGDSSGSAARTTLRNISATPSSPPARFATDTSIRATSDIFPRIDCW